jgi:hypothetical protein
MLCLFFNDVEERQRKGLKATQGITRKQTI